MRIAIIIIMIMLSVVILADEPYSSAVQDTGYVVQIYIPGTSLFPADRFPHMRGDPVRDIPATLYIPANFDTINDGSHKFPLLIYLHGGWDGHNQNAIPLEGYNRRDCFHGDRVLNYMIENNVIEPTIAVAPFADDPRRWENGWWGCYENFVIYDVISYFVENYNVDPDRIILNGLCDGGMAAIEIALRHPEKFSYVGCTSGAFPVHLWQSKFVNFLKEHGYNSHLKGVFFTCGVEDKFIDYNRTLHQFLSSVSFPHIYNEIPCGHDFDTWGQDFFDFLYLGINARELFNN